jgi:hypothetical protein
MFLLPISLFNSSFYLIRHVPSLSVVGPIILLNTFLSNTPNLYFMFSFNTHVSQAYVTVGLTNKGNIPNVIKKRSLNSIIQARICLKLEAQW